MPYIFTFAKPIQVADRTHYINDCCVGGDIVLERLLPALRSRYGELQPIQEDWGWFASFRHAGAHFAIDVHNMDHVTGEFQAHLTSRTPRRFWRTQIEDVPELELLRELILAALSEWSVTQVQVERVNEKYLPA